MTEVVVDTSALVAVLWQEADAPRVAEVLRTADARLIAAPTVVELTLVLEGRAPALVGIATRTVRDLEIDVVSFDESMAVRAADAFRRFGKGRHPAALNLGDCYTYALAEERNAPILCVGADFARTDLPVLP